MVSTMNAELKRQHYSDAAKRRWAEGSIMRSRAQARQRARELQNDLKILDRVIRGVRAKLKERAEKRVWAREYWRANSDQLNDRRSLRRIIQRLNAQPKRQRAAFADRQAELRQAAVKAARRYAQRIQSRLKRVLRRRFQKAFRYSGSYSQAIPRLTGCSLEALRLHLERLWQPGMSWENYGYWGWHIDHIRPIASFDLEDPEQRVACFHFSNLQPLWQKENFAKRASTNAWDYRNAAQLKNSSLLFSAHADTLSAVRRSGDSVDRRVARNTLSPT